MFASVATGDWPDPPRLEDWNDFDDVVAECYDSLTNQVFIYPPGSYWIGLTMGKYQFAPDDEIAGVTNLVDSTLVYGVPVWQVDVLETVDVDRVWLYFGEGSDYFRTNDAPDIVDMEQWVEDAYIVSPPAYLTQAEREQWYADRARERFGFTISLICSNDWPALEAGINASITNNPPVGAKPLVTPDDTNRIAFASMQSLSNMVEMAIYTPVDDLPVDVFYRTELGPVTNGWSMRSTFYAEEPFDMIQTPVLSSNCFYLAARADIDSDGDGIPDGREKFVLGTDPYKWDSAGLFFGDFLRMYVYGLDPLNRDSNGDGMDDDEAILNGYNPVTTTVNTGSGTIRYYYDDDDRLQAVYTTTDSGDGGGAAQYELSPAHNTISINERSEP